VSRRRPPTGTRSLAIYTYYPCRGGAPASLEAAEHPSDAAALEAARRVLAAHGSCDSVEVWQGERFLGRHGGADARTAAG